MNASITPVDDSAPATARPVHTTHKFKLLLQREFWEHQGGFLRAPLIAGGISLLLTAMAIGVALFGVHQAARSGGMNVAGMTVNGLDLGLIAGRMGPDDIAKLGQGIDLTLFLSSVWPFIVLGFVAFFYCLGALYDERKDRSVLFWKSLPVSDAQTVLSKVVTVTVVAPILAVIAAVLTMLGFVLLLSIVLLTHGGNPWTLLIVPSHPVNLVGAALAWIPVYALWSLPTVGWLMLCSAWARSKPFLWAIMLPLFAGIFVSWFGLMDMMQSSAGWFWKNIVGRLLLGLFPGMDIVYRVSADGALARQPDVKQFLSDSSMASQLASFTMPQLWIGALAGVVMIFAAIQLRQRRELAD